MINKSLTNKQTNQKKVNRNEWMGKYKDEIYFTYESPTIEIIDS